MDVFLIPTLTSARYELYYESQGDDDLVDIEDGDVQGSTGWLGRLKRRVADMLREAEEWRHRRQEAQPDPQTFTARLRRRVMGFIVERIAEQRLLWHLRRATKVCAYIPDDLAPEDADAIIRASLRRDADHHFKWLWIDAVLVVLIAPLSFIPGPNLPGFYFTFQVVSHFLSWRGAKRGLALSPWTFETCAPLSELRAALRLEPGERQRYFHDVAARLRLEHLATFLEDVAARAA